MQGFYCRDAGPNCDARFAASHKDDLMRQVAQHAKEVHKVERPTQTIMSYLATTVREEGR